MRSWKRCMGIWVGCQFPAYLWDRPRLSPHPLVIFSNHNLSRRSSLTGGIQLHKSTWERFQLAAFLPDYYNDDISIEFLCHLDVIHSSYMPGRKSKVTSRTTQVISCFRQICIDLRKLYAITVIRCLQPSTYWREISFDNQSGACIFTSLDFCEISTFLPFLWVFFKCLVS